VICDVVLFFVMYHMFLDHGTRIKSLQDASSKMSKSDRSPHASIFMTGMSST